MKAFPRVVCCIALVCFPAAGQKKRAPAGMTDQQFVVFAAQTDMMEAHLGQMAANQASGQRVKDYARMLVDDHTKDYSQLGAVAAKANLTEPKALDKAHDRMIAPFNPLKGQSFDARYIREMVAGHTSAIAVYKREAANAHDAGLKAYASDALPTLQKHLDGAKALEKSRPAGRKKRG